jgi:hypothetical protein
MEKIQHTYNDVVVVEGEPASTWMQLLLYFTVSELKTGCSIRVRQLLLRQAWRVQAGQALLRARTEAAWPKGPLLRRDIHHLQVSTARLSTTVYPQLTPLCFSQHYFGFYEAILGVTNAVFSVLVSSPTAALYRVDRVDFRQILLKDAATEQLLRQEVVGISARADSTSVMRDLRREAKWKQYKHELVVSVLTRHEEEHVPIMGPRPDLGSYRSAREPNLSLPKLPLSPTCRRGSQTERGVPGVSSGQLRRAQKPLLDKPKPSPRRSRGDDASWLSVSASCKLVFVEEKSFVVARLTPRV